MAASNVSGNPDPSPSGSNNIIHRLANRVRQLMDSRERLRPVLQLALATILTSLIGYCLQTQAKCRTGAIGFTLFDLQLSFSASAFSTLVREAQACGRTMDSVALVLWDTAFPIGYAISLMLLIAWLERWRRVLPEEQIRHGRETRCRLSLIESALILAPAVAAIADTLVENPALFLAARAVSSTTDAPDVWVLVGSLGAAIKWSLLGITGIGALVALVQGPRGTVLWRVRYSVFAVLLGALPLLVVPQGQDILQRLIEGAQPLVRILGAIAVLAVAAVVNWYCARCLSRVRLSTDTSRNDPWFPFFERNIPRMLGVATLLVAALAFARVADAPVRFLSFSIGSYLLAIFVTTSVRKWVGRMFIGWIPSKHIDLLKADTLLPDRLGRAVFGIVAAVLVVLPDRLWPLRLWPTAATWEFFLLRIGAGGLLVVAWGLFLWVYFRRDYRAIRDGHGNNLDALREQELEDLARGYSPDTLPAELRIRVISAAVVSLGLFALFTFFTVPAARFFGPLAVLAITASNAVFIGSLIAYVGRKHRIAIVPIALAFATVVSMWNDNHAIRTLPASTATPVAPLADKLDSWLATQRAGRAVGDSTPIPLVLVAAAGGGLRAAYWTALTLSELQDRNPAFASHLFAISGVSGGSLGGALFAAMLQDQTHAASGDSVLATCSGQLARVQPSLAALAPRDTSARRPYSACAKRFLGDDFLAPALAKFVTADFAQWFLPVPIPAWDRAVALETSWEESYRAATGTSRFSESYTALSQSSGSWFPALLLNTTHVESGRRYITAPFSDPRLFSDAVYVHEALGGRELRLSTAAHNSARFSYVSPAGRIDRRDGNGYGALVDGGYFENSGLATLHELRDGIQKVLAARGDSPAVRIIVLYLCNDPLGCLQDTRDQIPMEAKRATVGEWFAPARTLLATRSARGSLAREQVRRSMPERDFIQLNVCDRLRPAESSSTPTNAADTSRTNQTQRKARERIVNPPLGWLLSAQARRWMDSSLVVTDRATDNCPRRNVADIERIVSLLR